MFDFYYVKLKATFNVNYYVLFSQYSLLYQNKNAREDVNLWITPPLLIKHKRQGRLILRSPHHLIISSGGEAVLN